MRAFAEGVVASHTLFVGPQHIELFDEAASISIVTGAASFVYFLMFQMIKGDFAIFRRQDSIIDAALPWDGLQLDDLVQRILDDSFSPQFEQCRHNAPHFLLRHDAFDGDPV